MKGPSYILQTATLRLARARKCRPFVWWCRMTLGGSKGAVASCSSYSPNKIKNRGVQINSIHGTATLDFPPVRRNRFVGVVVTIPALSKAPGANQSITNITAQPNVNKRARTSRYSSMFSGFSRSPFPLITVWLQVRVLPGPPRKLGVLSVRSRPDSDSRDLTLTTPYRFGLERVPFCVYRKPYPSWWRDGIA